MGECHGRLAASTSFLSLGSIEALPGMFTASCGWEPTQSVQTPLRRCGIAFVLIVVPAMAEEIIAAPSFVCMLDGLPSQGTGPATPSQRGAKAHPLLEMSSRQSVAGRWKSPVICVPCLWFGSPCMTNRDRRVTEHSLNEMPSVYSAGSGTHWTPRAAAGWDVTVLSAQSAKAGSGMSATRPTRMTLAFWKPWRTM